MLASISLGQAFQALMDSGSSSLVLFLHETVGHVGLSKIYAPYVNQVLSLPHGRIHFAGYLLIKSDKIVATL